MNLKPKTTPASLQGVHCTYYFPKNIHSNITSTLKIKWLSEKYLIIQQFLGDNTLIPHENPPHDPYIIYLFKDYLTRLVLPLTQDTHKANKKFNLHCKIAVDTEIS